MKTTTKKKAAKSSGQETTEATKITAKGANTQRVSPPNVGPKGAMKQPEQNEGQPQEQSGGNERRKIKESKKDKITKKQ
jgi:hypothetical protein